MQKNSLFFAFGSGMCFRPQIGPAFLSARYDLAQGEARLVQSP